jgi:hypothetical protein
MPDEPTPTPDSAEPDPTPTPPAEDEAAKWKALARKHEKEAKRLQGLESDMEKLREASQTEQEKALADARKEAASTATTEATTKANRRVLTAEIKAAAGTKLADPADAVRLLDLDSFDIDDDGEVDQKAITAAIQDLLKTKPYLAANGKLPTPSADGGPRRGTDSAENVSPGIGRLRHAYSTTSKKT